MYKADNIAQALAQAAERGAAISIYLETPDASEGKMSLDTVKALGEAVARQAQLYIWSKEKRPLTEDGKYGSLHAKIALADGRVTTPLQPRRNSCIISGIHSTCSYGSRAILQRVHSI